MGKPENEQPPLADDLATKVSAKFYKTHLHGLSVVVNQDDEDRSNTAVDEVKFTPVQFFDERHGEKYTIGYLETDDPFVQEVLDEDFNVVEINEKQYRKALKGDSED